MTCIVSPAADLLCVGGGVHVPPARAAAAEAEQVAGEEEVAGVGEGGERHHLAPPASISGANQSTIRRLCRGWRIRAKRSLLKL